MLLYYIGLKEFMIFHALIELFCIIIIIIIFVIAFNTYEINSDHNLIFLGIAFAFVAIFDTLHLFSYQGTNLLKASTNNLTNQFWIIARYIESITFLISILLYPKRINIRRVLIIYSSLSLFIILSLYFNIFPDAFIVGQGLTKFKIVSEFIVCGILSIVIILKLKSKKDELKSTRKLMIIALLSNIISQIFFIIHGNIDAGQGITGHIFRLISYYYIYYALIKSSLQEPYYSLVKVNSLYDDTNKELEYALGRIKDEYILAEQRKEESQRKSEVLNAILETTRNGIVVIGDDGKVVHFNQSLTKVLELSINITKETTIKEILYNVKENLINPDELISSLEELSSSHDVLTKICYFKDGRIIESSTLPFIDEGINKGMLSIFIDITDRVRVIELEKNIQIKQATIEKAREYDRLKDEFISIVSHELRTPLTIILGIIQLIDNIYGETDSCHVSQLASHLSIMKQNCFRLVKLTNNLIDINKIDSGFLDIKFRNQDIINAIEGITLSVAEYVKSKEINLIFDTDVEEKIMGFDSYLMERVMLNLLSNAVKFTEKGGKIEVDILDHEDRIVIKVRDNGIGIPKDKADVIFDRFMQVDTSLSRKSEGSGIGLSLVKLIVEEHKGKIYLNTDIDIGTEFIIELPVNLQENDLFEKLTEQDINMERLDIEFSDVYD